MRNALVRSRRPHVNEAQVRQCLKYAAYQSDDERPALGLLKDGFCFFVRLLVKPTLRLFDMSRLPALSLFTCLLHSHLSSKYI